MNSFWKGVRSGHVRTLIASLLYFDVSFMVWVLVGALGVYIAEDLRLSATQKGVLVAVAPLGGTFFRIVLGLLADWYGPKKMGAWSLSLALIPLAWGSFAATTFHQLVAVGLLLGIAGASFAIAMSLVSRSYPPEHQGVAMGIAGAGNSGTVLASLIAPRLAAEFGWHAVFGLAMIPVVLVLVLFLLLARETPRSQTAMQFSNLRRVLREPDLWWFSFFYSLTFGGFVGLSGFLGIFLHDQYGTPAVQAGFLTAVCVFGGSFFRPVGGYLADRWTGTALLLGLFPILEAAFLATGFATSLAGAVSLIFVGMAALGAGNGAVFQIVPQRFREEIGAVSGIVGAAGGIGGFFFPMILGGMKDVTGSYHVGFVVYVAVVHMALLPLRRFHNRTRGFPVPKLAMAPAIPTPQPIRLEPAVRPSGWIGERLRMEVAFPGIG